DLARFATTRRAYVVIGTSPPAAMIFTPCRERSVGEVLCAGLSAGTTIVRTFPANETGLPSASPLPTSPFGFDVSADRKTSAGAPCSIWVSRAADESVESVRTEPGWAASQAGLIRSRAPFRDAAPKMVSGAESTDGDDRAGPAAQAA